MLRYGISCLFKQFETLLSAVTAIPRPDVMTSVEIPLGESITFGSNFFLLSLLTWIGVRSLSLV